MEVCYDLPLREEKQNNQNYYLNKPIIARRRDPCEHDSATYLYDCANPWRCFGLQLKIELVGPGLDLRSSLESR